MIRFVSGSGKTTLMAALAYRSSGDILISYIYILIISTLYILIGGVTVEGDILINGRTIDSYMRFLSGFMHQEDIFVGSLTVWEHMSIMVNNITSLKCISFSFNNTFRQE